MVGCSHLYKWYWEDGQTLQQIGERCGRSVTTIQRWMNRCNIERRARGRTAMEIENLAEMYEGMSMREIAEALGVEVLTVSRAMDRVGIIRDKRHLYRCNPLPAFFEYDTAEMYYVLGLLFADGNISRRGAVTICQRKHPAILHQIARLLGRPVNRSGEVLRLGGRALADWLLENFDIGPAKSNTLQWPALPSRFMPDFIRGFFDGDGSVWFGRAGGKLIRNVSFTCGSRDFLFGLQSALQVSGMPSTQIYDVRSQAGHACRIIYRGKARTAWFYDYMYYSGCLCIKDKLDNFERAIA